MYYDNIHQKYRFLDAMKRTLEFNTHLTFSVIEAFSKGKPGVTIHYGDVAAAAGDDFCVTDYEEMIRVIKRYTEDKGYYEQMVKKGKIRAKEMTDSKAALEKILATVKERRSFF